MKINISLKRSIQVAIFFFIVLAVFIIWPMKLIRPWQVEGEINKNSTTIIQNEGTILQEFIPSQFGMGYIKLYIYNESELEAKEERLIFRLFNAGLQKIEEKEISLQNYKFPGIMKIGVGSELIPDTQYYFSVENPGNSLLFSMSDGVNLDVQYGYHVYYSKLQYAVYTGIILLLGIMGMALTEFLLRKNTKVVRIDLGIRVLLSFMTIVLSLIGMILVYPMRCFSKDWIDIIFYELGIVLFCVIVLFGLLRNRKEPSKKVYTKNEIIARIPAILQSVAFGGVMYGCVEYVNALYTFQQRLASNIIFTFFALVIICSFTKREICNVPNLILLVVSLGASIAYYGTRQFTSDVDAQILRGDLLVYISWAFVFLNIVKLIFIQKAGKVNRFYSIFLLITFGEMIRSRNSRLWPIQMCVCWGLLAIRIIYTRKGKEYLQNFMNGVQIHFLLVSLYSFLYRAFHYYIYTRYSSVFHTVTVATIYDVFVLTISLARFLSKYKKVKNIGECWWELCMVGLSTAFMLLTISRTGILTALVVCILILILSTCLEFKDGIKGILIRCFMVVAISFSMFITVFTGCRIVPCIVSNPFNFEYQDFFGTIRKNEHWDSQWFITVPQFFGMAEVRLNYYGSDGDSSTATEEETALGANVDYSNGRIEIYRDYLKALDWKGHEGIGLVGTNGAQYMHAHNSYLETAYGFGIFEGVLFLIMCIYTGIRSIQYYVKNKDEITGMIPLAIVGCFVVSSMVERVFSPYIPLGFAFLFAIVLLIPKEDKEAVIGVKYEKKD